MATGWLGWPARDAWETPVPQILMAWDAKLHFLIMTNPNGQPESEQSKETIAKEARMGFRAAAMGRNMDTA